MRSQNLRNRLVRLAARGPLPARVSPLGGRPRRVLLVRPDHIGDVLLTSPAIALLRASLPTAELTYLVGPWSKEAAAQGVAVDRIATLAFPGFTRRRKANVLEPYALLLHEALRLRQARFDLAVIFRRDHWWGALLALTAGVPVRVGGLTPETAPLLTHAYAGRPGEHAVDEALGVARLALESVGVALDKMPGEVVFRVGDAARAEAARWWARQGLERQRVVAIQPSAGAALKSWPIERWRALAARLDESVLWTGGPGDEALLRPIAAGAPVACGQRLELTAALFERCALVIAPDSGAAHLASAVGTPSLRLYGPAPVAKFGPWPQTARDQHVVLADALECMPCGYLERPPCGARTEPACMLALSVDQVLATAKGMLAQIEN